MKIALLTRAHDDHAFLHTGFTVDDEDGALAACAALLKGNPDILFVEVFEELPSSGSVGYTSWFRLGRDVEAVRGPKAPLPPTPAGDGVN